MSAKVYHIQTVTDDGVGEEFVAHDLQSVIEAALSKLSEDIGAIRVMGDEEEMRENDIRRYVDEWATNGWTGATVLEFPGGGSWVVKQASLGAPIETSRRDTKIQASDEEFDSLVASALGSIQWVIDDLRSWESNPESANYNADKLADAVTVIRARMSGKDN